MPITEERLRQTFSERLRVGATAGMGGAQEIYLEVKAMGDFLGFARQYTFSEITLGYEQRFYKYLKFFSAIRLPKIKSLTTHNVREGMNKKYCNTLLAVM